MHECGVLKIFDDNEKSAMREAITGAFVAADVVVVKEQHREATPQVPNVKHETFAAVAAAAVVGAAELPAARPIVVGIVVVGTSFLRFSAALCLCLAIALRGGRTSVSLAKPSGGFAGGSFSAPVGVAAALRRGAVLEPAHAQLCEVWYAHMHTRAAKEQRGGKHTKHARKNNDARLNKATRTQDEPCRCYVSAPTKGRRLPTSRCPRSSVTRNVATAPPLPAPLSTPTQAAPEDGCRRARFATTRRRRASKGRGMADAAAAKFLPGYHVVSAPWSDVAAPPLLAPLPRDLSPLVPPLLVLVLPRRLALVLAVLVPPGGSLLAVRGLRPRSLPGYHPSLSDSWQKKKKQARFRGQCKVIMHAHNTQRHKHTNGKKCVTVKSANECTLPDLGRWKA
jgi:hypothetical protein